MVVSTAEAGARKVARVLVVDDNRDAADSIGMLLGMWGYEHRVAYDGAAGLEAAQAFGPDCLLLDINMPRMDGFTLAQRVRQLPGLERAKLVALTAYADEANARRIREAGFEHHLIKPADPSELERVLTMLNEVVQLASQTRDLARQNIALAGETKELLEEVQQDLRDVKAEVKGLKQELRDIKQDRTEGQDG